MKVAAPLLWAMAGLLLTPLPGESTLQPRCDLYSLPGCPRNFNPVCGTDGETYANECMLCMSNKSAKRHRIYHTDTGENMTRIFK